MDKTKYFLEIFKKAEKKYKSSATRLAAEGWNHNWQILIATIMSAQTRDETTIPIAENLFKKYSSLEKLSKAKEKDVLKIFKSLNYNKTKAKNVIAAAKFILSEFKGNIPNKVEDLIKIPGVGRKTANLVIWEAHNKQGICVDTHVHRLANVLDIVTTKTPTQTEKELEKIVPKNLWGELNRIFVLWGKSVPGKDKRKLLESLNK